jgi:hypothetical protein
MVCGSNYRAKARRQWGKLTDDDLSMIKGEGVAVELAAGPRGFSSRGRA